MNGDRDMKKVFLVLMLLGSASFANASDTYQCQYAKAQFSNGVMGKLSYPVPANVEMKGSSIKVFRPDGTFLISPPLKEKNGQLLMIDDGSKVYASSSDKSNFAVSDKISKVTEQWDKCTSDSEVQNSRKWITYKKTDEMSDKVKATAAVSSLDGMSNSLQFSCESGSKNIFMTLISVDEIITDEVITTRVDKNKSNDMKISVIRNPNGSAAFGVISKSFLNQLVNGSKLLVRYGEYSKGGVTQTFVMNGFSDAIMQIKSDCEI